MTRLHGDAERPVLVGRSSSHFTRVARIFAAEGEVDHELSVVRDLLSTDPAHYGENPALKIPSLRTAEGTWFGAQNVARELWRRSAPRPRVLWPEELPGPLLQNAHELVQHAMATEGTLLMARFSGAGEGTRHHAKMRTSLTNTLEWLEARWPRVEAELPKERDLSFLEVAMVCLVTHLSFREVLNTAPYAALLEACDRLGKRHSVASTAYRMDA